MIWRQILTAASRHGGVWTLRFTYCGDGFNFLRHLPANVLDVRLVRHANGSGTLTYRDAR